MWLSFKGPPLVQWLALCSIGRISKAPLQGSAVGPARITVIVLATKIDRVSSQARNPCECRLCRPCVWLMLLALEHNQTTASNACRRAMFSEQSVHDHQDLQHCCARCSHGKHTSVCWKSLRQCRVPKFTRTPRRCPILRGCSSTTEVLQQLIRLNDAIG
jgi:hypothetical protein